MTGRALGRYQQVETRTLLTIVDQGQRPVERRTTALYPSEGMRIGLLIHIERELGRYDFIQSRAFSYISKHDCKQENKIS